MDFDVFNGDADGICALHQLRMHTPRAATLITGVKRDIALLKKVPAEAGTRVTVLDISLEVNREDLLRLLEGGATVEFFDHHRCGAVPSHPYLQTHIDTDAKICTSLIVNRYLQGRYALWAVVAAYGDNLVSSADVEAQGLGLDDAARSTLRELGECLNYNAYGESLEDLLIAPADLYCALHPYEDPFTFIDASPIFSSLREGYRSDMENAKKAAPLHRFGGGEVYVLPDAAWARRVSGVFGNHLCNAQPTKAHAVLSKSAGGFRVSVRAPLRNTRGAGDLCTLFESGGGRAGAAGINHLPEADLPRFLRLFEQHFPELNN